MKTLYVNINGEPIRSSENIEVIGTAEDSIVDSFYISLGMAIADGVTGIKFKPLVADFAKEKPEEFKPFMDQWNEVKAKILGDNPSGVFDFVLSSEYLDWLKMNATYSEIYYKKYQGLRQATVKLDLDELYEDTLHLIGRRCICFLEKEENYKNFDKFVMNDGIVNGSSCLPHKIKSLFPNISFIPYKKEGKPISDWSVLFPFCEVIIGKSTLNDVRSLGIFDLENYKGRDYAFFMNETIFFSKDENEKTFTELNMSHVDYRMSKHDFPNYWFKVLGIKWEMPIDDCRDALLKQNAHRVTYYGYISPEEKYIIVLGGNNEDKLSSLYVTLNECPHCNSTSLDFNIKEDKLYILCNKCGHTRFAKH